MNSITFFAEEAECFRVSRHKSLELSGGVTPLFKICTKNPDWSRLLKFRAMQHLLRQTLTGKEST